MQLGIGRTVFPAWAASLTLVKAHGGAAGDHATAAIRAETGAKRLDHAVRAMTSFDHAVDNSRKLPVDWFLSGAPSYYRGYEAARQAVNLIVASGLVPGARERVGLQSLLAAKETFHAGVDAANAGSSRYGRHLASGWLEATIEDALLGVGMLRPDGEVARSLLAGVGNVRSAVTQQRPLDPALVKGVSELFDRAASQLATEAARTGATQVAVTDPTAFARSGALLEVARDAARAMVANAPAESVLDSMAATR